MVMSNTEKILIVDFMYLWNRIYAIKGANTSMHIFNNFKVVDESDYYFRKLIVLDGLHSTSYRRKIYSDYKTNRSDKSSTYELMNKFLINNASKFKTINFMKNDEYEADDLITAIVQYYKSDDKYIYSGDTDLYQLLRYPKTYIGTKYIRGMIIEPITKEAVNKCYNKRYGIDVKSPSYIIKCKTFKGDTSDNIPIACSGMRTSVINTLIENFWQEDEPLTSKILFNMAMYLKHNGSAKDFQNFYNNRKALVRNYKLCQLGYTPTRVWENTVQIKEDGTWA